jgi:hypothetical protein
VAVTPIFSGPGRPFIRRTLTPEQIRENKQEMDITVGKVDSELDARYNSMTEAQREAYYVHPNLVTRVKRWFQRD